MSRVEKVAQALKREISNIIHDEIKDPRLGFITVIRVELTRDLRFAKVYYSILGSQKERDDTMAALESAKGFIRRLIGQRIELRFTPEIDFREDRSFEYSFRIEEELSKLKESDGPKRNNRGDKKK